MTIPKLLKNYHLFVQGNTYAGLCSSVTLPDFEIMVEEYRAGGMDMPAKLDLGMEPIDIGWTMSEHNKETLATFGLRDQAGATIRFRAALQNDSEIDSYEISAVGMVYMVSLGEVEVGQVNPVEFTMSCRDVTISFNGDQVIYIDVDRMIREIDGVDQLERVRAALQL